MIIVDVKNTQKSFLFITKMENTHLEKQTHPVTTRV